MKFQSHVPDFIESDPVISKRKFKSIDSLLNHPWIKEWNTGQEEFSYYWVPNDGIWSKSCLMAMWKKDKKYIWFVLGYMDEIPSSLPEWKKPE